MFCGQCGASISDTAKFCPKCGEKVITLQAAAQPAPAASVQTAPAAQKDAQPAPAVSARPAPAAEPPTLTWKTSKAPKKSWSDRATDFLSSKLTGSTVETIPVTMEEMLAMVKEHFIDPASTQKDYSQLRSTLRGKLEKCGDAMLTSKDGKYDMTVYAALIPGGHIDVTNIKGSNWITVTEKGSGLIYQYSTPLWNKFKKIVMAEIDRQSGGL